MFSVLTCPKNCVTKTYRTKWLLYICKKKKVGGNLYLTVKGRLIDSSHLIELKEIYTTEIYMKRKKNH